MEPLPSYLDVANNSIHDIDESLTEKLSHINRLNLSGNPWKCSCKSRDLFLIDFLLARKAIPCCPKECVCSTANIENHNFVTVNCSSCKMKQLPLCLPFDKVKLVYANNSVGFLSFTRDQENVTQVGLRHNIVQKIDSSSLKFLKHLEELDLGYNLLQSVPFEFRYLKSTKIDLDGNNFDCYSCELVKILDAVTAITPQNITCSGSLLFHAASTWCFLKFTVIPYASCCVSLIISVILFYKIIFRIYAKWLGRKYDLILTKISKRAALKAFKRQCFLHKSLSHESIRKLEKVVHQPITFTNPVVHVYLERVECSIRHAIRCQHYHDIPLKKLSSIKHFLQGIHYLHSQSRPITHGHLSVETVFVKREPYTQSWILKIGDFS